MIQSQNTRFDLEKRFLLFFRKISHSILLFEKDFISFAVATTKFA
ncbi:hypothetical protein LEP1GSC061_1683 [Leptospira wolffii serovar Khorat str. Khorat-H2]|nr:hypothetical protein LEP1GSC061_1683 [Leptospira wolffii serovar Khorat str. Khorat-H2]